MPKIAKAWPSADLESVTHCPVCGEAARRLLHADLMDKTFHVAPGNWALWSCERCQSAYLDPRPSPASIYRAYSNYYTHEATADKATYSFLSPMRKWRRRMVNGYTNWRYGSTALPSSLLGVLAAYALPSMKKVLDREYRHLPKCPKSGGHLLDVGCGNGSFLGLARSCGWQVVGLDPDPVAVTSATEQGLNVHQGGIEHFDGQNELFDVISLAHVIEHVHQPFDVLKRCHALLKPGGSLWLETPNIAATGHARFKANWRGLETPRHLALFNRNSLRNALIGAGFSGVSDQARPSGCAAIYKASFNIENGISPYSIVSMPVALQIKAALATFLGTLFIQRREFLTVTAKKLEK